MYIYDAVYWTFAPFIYLVRRPLNCLIATQVSVKGLTLQNMSALFT